MAGQGRTEREASQRQTAQLAREYLRITARGLDRAAALAELNRRFPGTTAARDAAAVALAERGRDVARAINDLPDDVPIRQALGGYRPPQATVGVQLEVHYTTADGRSRVATPVVNLSWGDTKAALEEHFLEWIAEHGQSYEVEGVEPIKVVGGAMFAP